MNQKRVLGLDYGQRRVGVAISDGLGLTAQPLEVVHNKKGKAVPAIAAIIKDRHVTKIVVGLPKHMNNDEGIKAEAARAFGTELEEVTGLPVVYIDERLTTVAAQRILVETNMSGGKKRQIIDKLAAAIILQLWLDSEKHKS